MAREIHDTLAQGLIGIIAQLEAAQLELAGRGLAGRARDHEAGWERHIGQAQALARESLTEARRSGRPPTAPRPSSWQSGCRPTSC
jgi:signal transduction histidine kinase